MSEVAGAVLAVAGVVVMGTSVVVVAGGVLGRRRSGVRRRRGRAPALGTPDGAGVGPDPVVDGHGGSCSAGPSGPSQVQRRRAEPALRSPSTTSGDPAGGSRPLALTLRPHCSVQK